jgi:hypothetical protein
MSGRGPAARAVVDEAAPPRPTARGDLGAVGKRTYERAVGEFVHLALSAREPQLPAAGCPLAGCVRAQLRCHGLVSWMTRMVVMADRFP